MGDAIWADQCTDCFSKIDADSADGLKVLNQMERKQFVSVYIDDILVFSQSLQEHLEHLHLVIQKIQDTGLKLKPTKWKFVRKEVDKWQFVRKEVEYLGDIITPDGLKTNSKLVESVTIIQG